MKLFKADSVDYKDLVTPKDTSGRQHILHSLMNIRMPGTMPENVLRVQDYLPDLEQPEKASAPIGRYGRMRKTYLEKHRPGLYERLLLSGRLYEHLAEIDTCCTEGMDRMVRRMADAEGITEDLKARDQLAWVGRMNGIRQHAEEVILQELIYG